MEGLRKYELIFVICRRERNAQLKVKNEKLKQEKKSKKKGAKEEPIKSEKEG